MGKKGDKLTQASVDAAEELVYKLDSIGGITHKRMFGGQGIFHENRMFGFLDSAGECFLKNNASTKADYEVKDSKKHSMILYYSIRDEVMNNPEMLITWVKKSIAITK